MLAGLKSDTFPAWPKLRAKTWLGRQRPALIAGFQLGHSSAKSRAKSANRPGRRHSATSLAFGAVKKLSCNKTKGAEALLAWFCSSLAWVPQRQTRA